MVAEIRLPPLGQTSDEMSIVEWYKEEGDRIEIAEPLLCVETDKSQVDVESAEEGIILKIIPQPNELLSSGTLLAYVGELGEDIPSEHDAPPNEDHAAPTPQPAAEPAATTAAESAAAVIADVPEADRRVRAAPIVRKIAAELGVDLSTVTGTGFGGIIERADVQKAAEAGSPAATGTTATPSITRPTEDQLSDVPPLRRSIARRLTKSVQTIPSFSIGAQLDATAARKEIADHGDGLTYTHLLLRSVARALREHPPMRRLWVEDGPKYRTLLEPNVGLAVAGEDSLYVVTIPAPDTLTLSALIETVSAAAGRGRDGALNTEDHAPATITVSNLGMYGVDSFDAVIDPDQNAILAVASVRDRVVPLDGNLALGVVPQLSVNLRCDHRSVDGVQAAKFIRTLASNFETDPAGPAPR